MHHKGFDAASLNSLRLGWIMCTANHLAFRKTSTKSFDWYYRQLINKINTSIEMLYSEHRVRSLVERRWGHSRKLLLRKFFMNFELIIFRYWSKREVLTSLYPALDSIMSRLNFAVSTRRIKICKYIRWRNVIIH